MGKLSLAVGVVTLCLALFIPGSDCCRCRYRSFHQHHCDAEYVLLVKVLSHDAAGWYSYYQVQVVSVYKGTDTIGTSFALRTSGSSAACGVAFTVNGFYLVMGYDGGHVRWHFSCGDYSKLSSALSVSERQLLTGPVTCPPPGPIGEPGERGETGPKGPTGSG